MNFEQKRIRCALRTDGLVRIVNVLDQRLVSQAFNVARGLFHLPESTLQTYCRRDDGGGYTAAGIEGVRDLPKDPYRRFWDICHPEHARNTFPDLVQQRCLETLYLQLETVAHRFYGEQFPSLVEMIRDGKHGMRLTHYGDAPPMTIMMPRHLDFQLGTLYVGGSEPGLQGRSGDAWVEIENPIGDVAIGVGTALRLYEPDLKAFCHRVVGRGAERISIAFFLSVSDDVMLPNGEQSGARCRRISAKIRPSDA